MRRGLVFLVVLPLSAVALIATGAAPPDGDSAKTVSTTDIEVVIRHVDGSEERFGENVAQLDLVVGPNAQIEYVHMILVTGQEKDTHAWYNYRNLAGLTYRVLAITGKGKVKVKQLGSFDVEARTGLQTKIPLLSVDDYR